MPTPRQPPLDELIALRRQKFPGMFQKEFARKFLGCSRLHMNNIERGVRRVSLEMALKWLDALGPQATMEMFGELPLVEHRVRSIRQLQKVAPEFTKAA